MKTDTALCADMEAAAQALATLSATPPHGKERFLALRAYFQALHSAGLARDEANAILVRVFPG